MATQRWLFNWRIVTSRFLSCILLIEPPCLFIAIDSEPLNLILSTETATESNQIKSHLSCDQLSFSFINWIGLISIGFSLLFRWKWIRNWFEIHFYLRIESIRVVINLVFIVTDDLFDVMGWPCVTCGATPTFPVSSQHEFIINLDYALLHV